MDGMSILLLLFLASMVPFSSGLQLSGCQSCLQKSVDHSFECIGAGADDTIIWKYEGGSFEQDVVLAQCGSTDNSCISLYAEDFSVTRATNTSSVLTWLNPDPYDVFWDRYNSHVYCVVEPSDSRSNGCSLDFCDVVEDVSCCVTLDDSTGEVFGGCYAGKAWSNNGNQKCSWYEKWGNYPEKVVEEDYSAVSFKEEETYYYAFKCTIQHHVPDVTSAYRYRVVISPGDLEYNLSFSSSCVLPMLDSEKPPTHTPWCKPDKKGSTCIILIVAIPVSILLVGFRILLCRVRPRKDRKGCLEWQYQRVAEADDEVPEGKFQTVNLWCSCLWHYILCCCLNSLCVKRKC